MIVPVSSQRTVSQTVQRWEQTCVFHSQTVNPLWKVPFTPGISFWLISSLTSSHYCSKLSKIVYTLTLLAIKFDLCIFACDCSQKWTKIEQIHGMFSCYTKRKRDHFPSPDSFLMRFWGTHLHLFVAEQDATNFLGFFPCLKPLESNAPPDRLLSVFTTNSSGGKTCRSQSFMQKVPVTIPVLNTCGVVSLLGH